MEIPTITPPPKPGLKQKKDNANHTIKAKWGERLFKVSETRRQAGMGGYIPIVRSFLRLYHKMGLSPQAAMAVVHIIDGKWDNREPWISAALLATRMNKSDSQVKKYIKDLRERKVVATYDPKKRTYNFNFDQFFEEVAKLAEAEIADFNAKQEAEDAY